MYTFTLSELMRHVRRDGATLPDVDIEEDTDAPTRKMRKFVGDEFVEQEKQVALRAFQIQKWWNMKASKRSIFKRWQAYPEFGKLITHFDL